MGSSWPSRPCATGAISKTTVRITPRVPWPDGHSRDDAPNAEDGPERRHGGLQRVATHDLRHVEKDRHAAVTEADDVEQGLLLLRLAERGVVVDPITDDGAGPEAEATDQARSHRREQHEA